MSKKRFDDISFGGKFFTISPPSGGLSFIDKAEITEVIYNNPATIVKWSDNTKTVSKCSPNDNYDPTTGLLSCIVKKLAGNDEFRRTLNDWYPENNQSKIKLCDVRSKHRLNKNITENN